MNKIFNYQTPSAVCLNSVNGFYNGYFTLSKLSFSFKCNFSSNVRWSGVGVFPSFQRSDSPVSQ